MSSALRYIIRTDADAQRVGAEIARMQPDHALSVVVSRHQPRRSLDANAYLWGALYPAIQAHVRATTGDLYSTEDLHEYFKSTLLPPTIVDIGGSQRIVPGSSARLTVAEFARFCGEIEAYFVETLGGILPANPRQLDEQ